MSTSSAFVDSRFAKHFVIACCVVPGVLLLWDAYQGQLGVNSVNFAIRTTGLVGLVLITLALAITPLRRITKWNTLIAVRRNFGVFGFFYIALHFAIFFVFDRELSIASTLHEISERVYLWFGFGALVLMIPLAITSFDGMVSRLGGKRWKRLHRLTYVVALAGVIHFYLLVKADVTKPLAFAAVIGALLVARLAPAPTPAPLPRKRFWSGELRIASIITETHDVKTFRFVAPDGGRLPFEHVAGQYLNLKLTIEGKRVNRSYTIASPPTRRDHCEISVKRVGYASQHLHDTWREGELVNVSAPAGKFTFAGHESDRIVLIAGGIGITPMMAVVRSLCERKWRGRIYLVFSVRAAEDIVFRDELAALQAQHENLAVQVTVTGDSAWDGVRGRITRSMLERFVPGLIRGPIMVCGPDAMMIAVRAILVDMGIPDDDVRQEAFVSPLAPPPGEPEPIIEGVRNLTFARAGKAARLVNGLTVLEAAEEHGVEIPFECQSGICGQCKTRLISGRVAMEVEDALTAADKEKGLILACQARAVGDAVVDA